MEISGKQIVTELLRQPRAHRIKSLTLGPWSVPLGLGWVAQLRPLCAVLLNGPLLSYHDAFCSKFPAAPFASARLRVDRVP